MEQLSKAQVKYLRKLSHSHKPIFQMGKLGLTDVFIKQVDEAIEKRELIKFNILQNSEETIEEAAAQIAEGIDALVVQTVGNTAILYRESSREKFQKISRDVANIA